MSQIRVRSEPNPNQRSAKHRSRRSASTISWSPTTRGRSARLANPLKV